MERKRYLKPVILLLLAGAVVATALLLPVRQCEIVGQTRYAAKEYEAAIGLPARRIGLIRANIGALTKEIEGKLPYADVTSIRPAFPTTLRLYVKDKQAVFSQRYGTHWWLVSETGQLLELTAALPPAGSLTVTGLELEKPKTGQQANWKGSRAAGRTLSVLMQELRRAELAMEITGIRVTSGPVPDAVYQNRLRLRFGAPPPGAESEAEILREKLRLARQTIAALDAKNPGQQGVLDLSIMGEAYFSAGWES